MSMANIPGQARAKTLLKKMAARSRVPHALLFTGEAGIGKGRVAQAFAKILHCGEVCEGDSCDRCSSCRKIDSGQAPDLLWVKKEGAFIKIDQVRQIKERLKYRPFEAPSRVVVIEDAHDLKEEAANAFLKILEEPPRQNVFILISLEPRMVLPTIVSRCCHIRFQPLDEDIIEGVLKEQDGLDVSVARKAARLASGSLERARKLADMDIVAAHEEIRNRIRQLHAASMIELFTLTARWAKESRDLDEDLECIKLWLRDMIHQRLTTARLTSLQGGGRRAAVQPEDGSFEQLFRLFDFLEQAHQQLRVNANKQLLLEGVCLAIRKTINGEGHWDSLPTRGQDILL
jgi:DNA polymerase-3 subunit delta'